MKNRARKSVRQWWTNGGKRSLTSVFLCLLCAAMLVSSMSMALPVYAQEQSCTLEEHTHGEGCYVQVTSETETRMACSVEADAIVHRHTDFCYDEAGDLRCTLEEREAHTHGEDCLDEEGTLICRKEELALHTHEADCYAAEGALVCESAQVVEHVHTEECFATEEVPVDTEAVTCTVTDETHEHTALCHGTWVLDCDLPEHAHTEACGITAAPTQTSETPTETTEVTTETTETTEAATETNGILTQSELTEEEQILVNSIIARIETLPTSEEIANREQLFLDAGDTAGLKTYQTEINTQVWTINKAYTDLEERLQVHVTNWDKLTALQHILERGYQAWPAADYAYISQMTVTAVADGTYPFDLTDGPGKDASVTNGIIRTFDTVEYSVLFSSVLRDEAMENNVSGYLSARVHYEIILPVPAEDAIFNLEGMSWLKTFEGSYFDCRLDEATGRQILRGSFVMRPAENANTAIPGKQSLTVAVRALRMCHGETLEPRITMWLECNDVVDEDDWMTRSEETEAGRRDGLIHSSIITDAPHNCGTHNVVESQTLNVGQVTISAEPRYNVSIESNPKSNSSGVSVYDFGEGGVNAPHKQSQSYPIRGRIYSLGITVEMVEGFTEDGKSKGLRGAAFPDENETIMITVNLRAGVKGNDEKAYHLLPEEYQALVWSAGENSSTITNPDFERDPHTQCKISYYTPLNRLPDNLSPKVRGYCYNGGDWTFEINQSPVSYTIDGVEQTPVNCEWVKISIKNFEVNFAQMPWGFQPEDINKYYDPEVVKNDYWLMEKAVISSGELWVLLPYESNDGNRTPLTDLYPDGTTLLWAFISGVRICPESVDGPVDPPRDPVTRIQQDNVDYSYKNDNVEYTDPFEKPGGMDTIIRYAAVNSPYTPLIKGCERDQMDWALSGPYYSNGGKDPDGNLAYGQQIGAVTEFGVNEAEGLNRVVGADILMKFDDRFFCPENFFTIVGVDIGQVLWAAKPNGEGWDHKGLNPDQPGYDTEMMMATQEDLIYFESLQDLKNAKCVCVGVLAQKRDVLSSGAIRLILGATGSVHPTAQPGYVYMIAFSSRAWTMNDVLEQTRAYHNLSKDTIPTDQQFDSYADNCLPNWATQTTQTNIRYDAYPKASYIESYKETTGIDNPAENGHKNSIKAGYNDEGGIKPGAGADHFIDGCFLHSYVTEIEKTTAQTYEVNGEKHYKEDYELSLGQKIVAYSLHPIARRTNANDGGSADNSLITDVTIVDTIPEGMSVIPNEFYWAGQNGTIDYDQNTGKVENGLKAGEKDGNGAYMTVEPGEKEIVITLHNVTVTGDSETKFGEILYFCQLESTLPDKTQLTNTVSISSTQDKRPATAVNKNYSHWTIKISQLQALSFSKNCLTPIAQWWDELKFEMSSSNSGGASLEDVVIVDTLPFNGWDRSSFHGPMVVSSFSAEMLGEQNSLESIAFYYTTDIRYVEKRASDVTKEEILADWKPLTVGSMEEGRYYLNLPDPNSGEFDGTYEGTQTPIQITAIAAVGDIPAHHTLNMYSTLRLPDGQAGDVLYNYLSQSQHQTVYDSAQVVSRELSGLVWYDSNKDGIRQDGENLWSNVQVTLMQKNQNGEYAPVCYAGTQEKVVIQTGQSVSIQKVGSVQTYEEGAYRFMDLPAGEYAVCFNTGIQGLVLEDYQLTLKDKGDDNTLDSDAERYFRGEEFVGYMICKIVMPQTSLMTDSLYVSVHHDAGFCEPYELPLTGGMGTTIYYILGAVLTLPALAGLRRRKKH